MSKERGREQLFQLGVRYIKDRIENELMVNQYFNEIEIIEFFRLKYLELEKDMPFLKISEFPRVAIYLEELSKLKIHLQGWWHDDKKDIFLGGMQLNKETFLDFYLKEIEADPELYIRYGDKKKETFMRKCSEYSGFGIYGVKWGFIYKNYNFYKNKDKNFISINPIQLLKESGVN
jgi:hypothetical protein